MMPIPKKTGSMDEMVAQEKRMADEQRKAQESLREASAALNAAKGQVPGAAAQGAAAQDAPPRAWRRPGTDAPAQPGVLGGVDVRAMPGGFGAGGVAPGMGRESAPRVDFAAGMGRGAAPRVDFAPAMGREAAPRVDFAAGQAQGPVPAPGAADAPGALGAQARRVLDEHFASPRSRLVFAADCYQSARRQAEAAQRGMEDTLRLSEQRGAMRQSALQRMHEGRYTQEAADGYFAALDAHEDALRMLHEEKRRLANAQGFLENARGVYARELEGWERGEGVSGSAGTMAGGSVGAQGEQGEPDAIQSLRTQAETLPPELQEQAHALIAQAEAGEVDAGMLADTMHFIGTSQPIERNGRIMSPPPPMAAGDAFMQSGAILRGTNGVDLDPARMHALYGFEEPEIALLQKLKTATREFAEKHKDIHWTEKDADHLYLYLTSRMVYGDYENTPNLLDDPAAAFTAVKDKFTWDGTTMAGLDTPREFMIKELGFTEKEANLLRYKVRVQNQIHGDAHGALRPEAVIERRENFAQYKRRMEEALDVVLTDDEFCTLWLQQYDNMSNTIDFAHQHATTASYLAPDSLHPAKILATIKGGLRDSEREYYAGWLGDATIKTGEDKSVHFTPDDYMSDLDAANIMYLVREKGVTYDMAVWQYYNALENGQNRVALFLEHTPLEKVKSLVFDKLRVKKKNGVEALRTEQLRGAYNFIRSLENLNNELKDYYTADEQQ